MAAPATTMKFIPEGELRSDLLAGLKQGVLVAAGALVLTLPPAGLATLRAPTRSPCASSRRSTAAGPSARPTSARIRPRPTPASSPTGSPTPATAAAFPISSSTSATRASTSSTPDGRLIDTSPVLLGAAPGDDSVEGIGSRPMAKVRPEEKTTPAGRFVAEAGRNASGEEVVWVDYGSGGVDASRAPGRSRRNAGSSGWRRRIRPHDASPTAASTSRSRSSNRSSGPCFARPARWPMCCRKPAASARSLPAPMTRARRPRARSRTARRLSAFPDKFPDSNVRSIPRRPPPAATIPLPGGSTRSPPAGR